MSEKNVEMMRKFIEEKKKKSAEQDFSTRPDKNIGKSSKSLNNQKASNTLKIGG